MWMLRRMESPIAGTFHMTSKVSRVALPQLEVGGSKDIGAGRAWQADTGQGDEDHARHQTPHGRPPAIAATCAGATATV